jgi:dienelactone hydrolase
LKSLLFFAGCGTSADLPRLEPGLHGEVYLPRGEGPFPGLVIIHGSGGVKAVYREEARYLAEKGIAGLVIDYYSMVGQGGSTQEERIRRWEDWQQRVIQGDDFLRGMPEIDPDRVGLMGLSLGGAPAISVVPRIPEVAVLVDFFGPNIECWYISWWMDYKTESHWDELASFPPTIILHGSMDPIVSVGHSRDFFDSLKASGTIVEFHEFKGSLHAVNDSQAGFSKSTEQSERARALVLEFLDKYLKGQDG